MTTPAINRAAPSTGLELAPVAPQETPGFLETTVRITAVVTAQYYAGLAIWAYPVLGLTCYLAGALFTYSNMTGTPIPDLVNGICQRCIPAEPARTQPVSRNIQPIFIPSEPGSRQGTITFPVTILELSPAGTPRAHSPEGSQRAASPRPPTTLPPEQRASAPRNEERQEVMVLGDVPESMLRSVYIPRSAVSEKKTV